MFFAMLLIIPLIADIAIYSSFYLKYAIIIIISLPILIYSFRRKVNGVLLLIAILLTVRIAFNNFVFQDRLEEGTESYQKNGAIAAAELTGSVPLYIYEDTRIHHASTYYISRTKDQALERWYGKPDVSAYYIAERKDLEEMPPHAEIFSFETRIEGLRLSIIRFE
jgi:hypothetical protein